MGPAAVEALLAIRPQEAVIDPGASVFNLSAGQISRRIKAATKMAGLGDGFSAHSPRAGMAQDLSAAGAELPELMTPGAETAPRCRPATPRPSPPAGGPSHIITGGSSETELTSEGSGEHEDFANEAPAVQWGHSTPAISLQRRMLCRGKV